MTLRKHVHALPDFRRASTATYVTGFLLSLSLTASAFLFVWSYKASNDLLFSRGTLIGLLAVLAITQMVVQVMFFLHLSAERKLRLNMLAGAFTIFVVLCLVIGSIWIMQNLDYNMGSHGTPEYVQQQESIHT
ncbi:MAG: cytochrome o ubiquinol oxidase subunit IV [Candidatus Saccharimonadales bacterium]